MYFAFKNQHYICHWETRNYLINKMYSIVYITRFWQIALSAEESWSVLEKKKWLFLVILRFSELSFNPFEDRSIILAPNKQPLLLLLSILLLWIWKGSMADYFNGLIYTGNLPATDKIKWKINFFCGWWMVLRGLEVFLEIRKYSAKNFLIQFWIYFLGR